MESQGLSATTAPTESSPSTGDRLEYCRQACFEALERGDWLMAVQQQAQLRQMVEDVVSFRSDLSNELWSLYAGVMNTTLARLHPVLITTAEPALQALPRAEICWQLLQLLGEHRALPVVAPEWLAVLEQQLVQDGAQYWLELVDERAEAAGRALALYERLAALHDPCPDWVRLRCEQLRAIKPAEQAPLPDPLPVEPPSIAEQVHGWLDCHGGEQGVMRLGLIFVPDQSPVSRDPRRLDLNLAPLLRTDEDPETAMAAFLEPLQELEHGTPLEVREPCSHLYESLGYLWRLGQDLDLEQYALLNKAAASWSRMTGPGCLGGKLLPSSLPALKLAQQPLLVQLDATELALMQSVVYDPASLEPALAVLRREHLNEAFWREQSPDWWFRPTQAVESLRRFQRDQGFYAGSAAPMESLECWSRGALACLSEGTLWSETPGWPSDPSAGWFMLPISQAITRAGGRVPELFRGPDPLEFYPLMAGQEVVYVGPLAEAVERHHHSGSSFQLFHDRHIDPFGLRCLPMPRSLHPQRPHGSFEESLEVMLEEVERLHQKRPFALVLVAAGAYRLPLCQEIRRRYGVTCLALGAQVHQLFGVERAGEPSWRALQRRPEHWRSIDPSG